MATYPTAKVHRVNRRKLGKGQFPTVATVDATLTASTVTMTITFDVPVVVSGIIPVTVAGGPVFVSQTVVSQTVVQQTWDASLAAKTYDLPANAANVKTFQGGGTTGESGTF